MAPGNITVMLKCPCFTLGGGHLLRHNTWIQLFARLQSLTNYAKHCGVKAASPLHLSPQICNVNSSLLFLSLGLIHLLDSFTPLMRVHPVCQLAPICHLDSDSQLIAKAAVRI